MIFLDEEGVRKLLDWDELMAAMERVLAEFSRGAIVQPVRSVITVEENLSYLGVMPAVAGDVMGLKLVTFYPKNAPTQIPTHQATILLYRTATGEPLAAMDGRLITEMRTAAVSAAITNYLAPPRSRVLALLGSGVQARAHLSALARIREFSEVRVWSRTPDHAQRFARERGAIAAASAEEAVRGADVVVTATAARASILQGGWLKPGAHVNAVGACRHDWRELDDAAMRGVILVDSRAAAAAEAGDIIMSKAEIYAEIGELFGGLAERPPAGATTIFKSLGLACEDLAAAKLVVDAATGPAQRV